MADNRNLFLLELSTFCVFAGRAWQHIFWDAPYRELFWDARWMQGIIENLTPFTWEEYVTHPMGDIWFQRAIVVTGVFYAVCAVSSFFVKKYPVLKWLMWTGAASLVFLAFVYLKDHFFHVGQFFEYTLQFASPLFLTAAISAGKVTKKLVFWMKVAVALTFACHALYALGYYPRPGYYTEMTMNILGMENSVAIKFLLAAGFLDFVVAVGIFMPRQWAKWILLYAVFWGFATSMARILGNFYWDFPIDSLHQWVYQAVFRFPHFLIPLLLFYEIKKPVSPSDVAAN